MRFLPPASVLPTLLIAPVWAAEFQITPGFTLAQYYSDNVALAPAGLERSDWVTVARPSVNLNYTRANLRFSAVYTAEVLYRNSEEDVELNNQFTGGTVGSMELLPQLLFLDTNSTVSQYNTSVGGPLATSNINTTNNRATVRTTSVSPYIRYNFGGEALALVRGTYSVVDSDGSGTGRPNSGGNAINATLRSGPGYVLTGWELAYVRDKVDYDAGRDYTLQNFTATVRRLLTPVLSVSATAGYEDNDYATLTGEQPDGASWNVGLNWTPTPRTTLAGTAGRRYFGRTYSLRFNHRMRRVFVTANYSEDVTSTRAQFLVPGQVDTAGYLDTLLLSRFPDPVERRQAVEQEIARLGLPATLIVPVNFFTDQVFLHKNWNGSAGLQGPVHTFLANFYTSTREQLTPGLASGAGDFLAGSTIEQYGTSASWSWRLTPLTASVVSLSYVRNETPAAGREDNQRYLRMAVNTRLGPRTTGSLHYQHLQSESNAAAGNYTENQVTAQLLMRF
jgi:uncharacterized protein (PEP-CTERM system associated)